MITLTLSFSIYTGKTWCARILGKSKTYGLSRDFVPCTKDSSRSGKTGYKKFYIDDPGIYQLCERGKRRFVRVNDDLEIERLSEDDAISEISKRT